jgi:hypothetical protein
MSQVPQVQCRKCRKSHVADVASPCRKWRKSGDKPRGRAENGSRILGLARLLNQAAVQLPRDRWALNGTP